MLGQRDWRTPSLTDANVLSARSERGTAPNSRREAPEAEHRASALRDGPMVLLDAVCQGLMASVSPRAPQDPADRPSVGRMGIRRDALRRALGHVDQAPQDAPGSMRVPVRAVPGVEEPPSRSMARSRAHQRPATCTSVSSRDQKPEERREPVSALAVVTLQSNRVLSGRSIHPSAFPWWRPSPPFARGAPGTYRTAQGWAELGGGAAQRPGRVVEIDGSGEGTGLVQRTGSDLAGAGEQASWLVAEELAQGGILRLPARRGRLRDARRHRARGDRPLARTAAAQRGLGNARPVAALVTRVPRAPARWCVPQRLRDGAAAEREHCVPRAVRALHCAIVFPPSLPIRCVGDNDDRSIRRGGAWHRVRASWAIAQVANVCRQRWACILGMSAARPRTTLGSGFLESGWRLYRPSCDRSRRSVDIGVKTMERFVGVLRPRLKKR